MNKARINSIRIRNIKSFKSGELTFHDGVTVISGENGSGKSTIFESLGFCLFGVGARDFIGKIALFVRHGESNGEVETEYTGVDGRDYRVLRKTRGGKALISVKSGERWYPVEGQGESDFIRRSLGLRSTIELSQQFRDIIGPFQSDFTAPFTLSPSERQDRFDKILGISRWRELFEQTSSWRSRISSKIENLNNIISLKGIECEDLGDLVLEREVLLERKGVIAGSIADLREEMGKTAERKKKLEGQEEELRGLKGELQGVGEKWESRRDLLEKTELRRANAEESAEIVEKTREGHKRYKSAWDQTKELEEKRKKGDNLRKKRSKLEQTIAAARARMETEWENLRKRDEELCRMGEVLESEIVEMREKLMTASGEREKFQESLEKLRGVRGRFDDSCSYIEVIRRQLEWITWKSEEAEGLTAEIARKEESLRRLPELEKSLGELERAEEMAESLGAKISSRESAILEKEQGRDLLREGTCPYFGESCRNLEGKDPDEYFNELIDHLKEEVCRYREDLRETKKRIGELRDEANRFHALKGEEAACIELRKKQAGVEREILEAVNMGEVEEGVDRFVRISLDFPRSGEITERLKREVSRVFFPESYRQVPGFLEELLKFFDETILEMERAISEETEEADRVFQASLKRETEYSSDLKNLEKRKSENAREALKLSKEKDSVTLEERKTGKLEDEFEILEGELTEYSDLDEILEGLRERMEADQGDFERYMEHQKTSAELPELLHFLETYKGEMDVFSGQRVVLEEKVKHLESFLEKEDVDSVRVKFREMEISLARMEEQQKTLFEDLTRLDCEILKREKSLGEIRQLESERVDWEETRKFTDFLRKKIFDGVAPRVAEVLRDRISEIAGEIFRAISGTKEELYWGEGYSVNLVDEVGGVRRERRDRQLSGGQFMSSVIALRLALLRTVNSPFAFFDEPTSYLDEERRKNLAEAFRSLNPAGHRWYRQLFLISHDESFQDISGNLIELELDEERCTRVFRR